VAAGIYRITTPLPFRPRSVHAYLLETANGLVLVDGGFASHEAWSALDAAVRAIGAEWGEIRLQVVTHMHVDHQGLVPRVVERAGCPVVMGRLDDERARHAREAPEDEAAYRRDLLEECGAPADLVERFARPRPSEEGFPDGAVTAVEGDEALPGVEGWRVVWTPGHTAGHISLFRAADGVLVAGDVVLPRVTPTIGANRQRPDPVADYLDALERLLTLGVRRSLGGHGQPLDPAEPRIRVLRQETRAETERVADLVGRGSRTVWDLVRLRYPDRELPPGMVFQAVRELRAHLDHLVARQALECSPGEDGELHFGWR